MVISFCPTFLPSLGDTAEQELASFEDVTPLFDDLIADPRFADLRRQLDGPAPGEIPVELAILGFGSHPTGTVLSQPDGRDVESTMIIPVVDAPTDELPLATRVSVTEPDDEPWLPDVGAPAHTRQHA